jgi:hypothetical protein
VLEAQTRCTQGRMSGDEFYATIGNKYQGAFRCVEEVLLGPNEVFVRLCEGCGQDMEPAVLGAALLDACTQPGILMMPHMGRPFVFASLESCTFMAGWSSDVVWAFLADSVLRIFDSQNRCVAMFGDSQAQFLAAGQLETSRAMKHMYESVWRERPLGVTATEGLDGNAVLVWGGEMAAHVCPGCTVVDSETIFHKKLAARSHTHVVCILDGTGAQMEDVSIVGMCLGVLQAVARMQLADRPQVWLVTRASQVCDMSLAHSSLMGLVRSMHAELGSGLQCACVDIDEGLDAEAAGLRLREEMCASVNGVQESEVC